jgi:hypothetical protein
VFAGQKPKTGETKKKLDLTLSGDNHYKIFDDFMYKASEKSKVLAYLDELAHSFKLKNEHNNLNLSKKIDTIKSSENNFHSKSTNNKPISGNSTFHSVITPKKLAAAPQALNSQITFPLLDKSSSNNKKTNTHLVSDRNRISLNLASESFYSKLERQSNVRYNFEDYLYKPFEVVEPIVMKNGSSANVNSLNRSMANMSLNPNVSNNHRAMNTSFDSINKHMNPQKNVVSYSITNLNGGMSSLADKLGPLCLKYQPNSMNQSTAQMYSHQSGLIKSNSSLSNESHLKSGQSVRNSLVYKPSLYSNYDSRTNRYKFPSPSGQSGTRTADSDAQQKVSSGIYYPEAVLKMNSEEKALLRNVIHGTDHIATPVKSDESSKSERIAALNESQLSYDSDLEDTEEHDSFEIFY